MFDGLSQGEASRDFCNLGGVRISLFSMLAKLTRVDLLLYRWFSSAPIRVRRVLREVMHELSQVQIHLGLCKYLHCVNRTAMVTGAAACGEHLVFMPS